MAESLFWIQQAIKFYLAFFFPIIGIIFIVRFFRGVSDL